MLFAYDRVCVCCGAEATVYRSRAAPLPPFRWACRLFGLPTWRLMPFCDRHKNYWLRRNLIGWGSVLAAGLLFGGSIALEIAVHGFDDVANDDPFVLLMIGGSLLVPCAALICCLTQLPAIQRPAH